MEEANWRTPAEVKAVYGTADVVGGGRIVFDICGNSYRLVVQFNYAAGVARVRFAGTHEEYDKIDVREYDDLASDQEPRRPSCSADPH